MIKKGWENIKHRNITNNVKDLNVATENPASTVKTSTAWKENVGMVDGYTVNCKCN